MRLLIALLTAAVALGAPTAFAASADDQAAADAGASEAKPTARVVIATKDYLQGTDFALTDEAATVTTPYSGAVTINRKVIAGVSFGFAHDDQILAASGERDVVYLKSGDKVSGEVVKTGDGTLLVKAFYGGGRESEIPLDKIDYITFSPPSSDEALELKPDPVRVIFANSDVVSGSLTGFKNGTFTLETQYAGRLAFTTDEIQSLHNADKTRQFFPGGLADALVYVFDNLGQYQHQYGDLLSGMCQGLLGAGDTEGALKLLEKMAKYDINLNTYDRLGKAFRDAKMPDAAALCFERLYAMRKRGIYLYRTIYQDFMSLERYARAAEVYEELLNEPAAERARYGFQDADIHNELAGVYDKIEEYEKAIGHLRAVLEDPGADPKARRNARTQMVADFKKVGRLDEFVVQYEAAAQALDQQLGADYLALVKRYVEVGKLAKASVQYERLVALNLDEFAAQAKTLIDAARAERGLDSGADDSASGDDE